MKLSIILMSIVSANLLSSGGALAADGARLFNAADFVGNAKETTSLNSTEVDNMSRMRSDKSLRSVTIVYINRAALDSSVITLVNPEGKEFQYVGTRKLNEVDKSYTWSGKSATGIFVISYDANSTYGRFEEGGKVYLITSLKGARFHAVSEIITPPPSYWGDDTPKVAPVKTTTH
jgi:hypothetical protein